jgi:hypothetical protein
MNEPNIIATESDKQLYGDESDKLKLLKKGTKAPGFSAKMSAKEINKKIIDTEFVDLPEATSTVRKKCIDTEMTR